MNSVKVNGLLYQWSIYKTTNFEEINARCYDPSGIEVLEIKGIDFDFHVVVRVYYYDLYDYCGLGPMLAFGKILSRKYEIVQAGVRLYINRPRILIVRQTTIENKHIEKLLQFINTDRFKPYITKASGSSIERRALETEVIEKIKID